MRPVSLPRTPIKETDRRAGRIEQRFGEGATELDALEAVHPGEFARIVTQEIERYWNPDHHDEVQDQLADLQHHLDDIVAEVHAEHADEIAALRAEVDRINEQLQPYITSK